MGVSAQDFQSPCPDPIPETLRSHRDLSTYQMRSRRRTSGGEAKQAAAALP